MDTNSIINVPTWCTIKISVVVSLLGIRQKAIYHKTLINMCKDTIEHSVLTYEKITSLTELTNLYNLRIEYCILMI